MKRWNIEDMQAIGRELFAKVHKQKRHTHHNHEIHYMARDMNEWLQLGIQQVAEGTYHPRCLKRYYFTDEVVDQLHLSDKIFQHVLLQQLKPTFKHVMNKNCYHLNGPTGVKYATQRIKHVLQDQNPRYIIRADIKSFYASIPHFKLIQDIKKHYNDPKVIAMLENIIANPTQPVNNQSTPVNDVTLIPPNPVRDLNTWGGVAPILNIKTGAFAWFRIHELCERHASK